MDITNRFKPELDKIEVSLIRQFDQKVSKIPGMLKMTLGEPDFNTPEHIKRAGIKAIEENYSHYTGMSGLEELRVAACAFQEKKYGLTFQPETECMVTVGATEAISASLAAILSPGDIVLMPTPAYPGYEPLIHLLGATPIYMDTTDDAFILTPENICQHLETYGEKVKAIILNYPSNPTGITYSKEEIKAIANECKKHPIFVLSDEVYSELTYDTPHISIAKYLPEQTILISGLSKSHAMTGWRIGFIFAPEKIASQLLKTHQYLVTSAATVSQKAAIEALTNGLDDANEMLVEYRKRRDFVYKSMLDLGFKVAKPSGAFYIFAKIPETHHQDALEFCYQLAEEEKLALIPGISFGESTKSYIRISYAASFENLVEAMERLKRFMVNNKDNVKH